MPLVQAVQQRLRTASARRRLSPTAARVSSARLTYLTPVRLASLEDLMRRIEQDQVAGGLIETGVALGGSAIVMAEHAVRYSRTFDGYDVFGMIPPPTAEDPPEVHERYETIRSGRSEGIEGDPYYGYRDDLYEFVTSRCAELEVPVGADVRLHKGLFEDTFHPEGPVALAHIDCDWHDPVRLCLERIYPRLSPGGFVILDDYHDYGGCEKAADDFLAANPDMSVALDREHRILRRDRQP